LSMTMMLLLRGAKQIGSAQLSFELEEAILESFMGHLSPRCWTLPSPDTFFVTCGWP